MTRELTIEDLHRFRVPSDIQLSRGGQDVAFVVTTMRDDADGYNSNIWTARVDESAAPFTRSDARDNSPRWSPDGKSLAFVSNRDGRHAPWLISRQGGEARRIGELDGEVLELAWSPDGTQLAAIVLERSPTMEGDVRHISRLRYKLDGQGFIYDRRKHIWLLDVRDGSTRALTSGQWDETSAVWSPDGQSVAFLSNRTADPDRNNVMDVWSVAANDPSNLRCLTASLGPCMTPAWSPDGHWIAYVGNVDPPETGVSTNHHVWVVPAEGGDPRDVMPLADLCLGSLPLSDLGKANPWNAIFWSHDGQAISAIGTERGAASLYRIEVYAGQVRVVVGGERHLLSVSVSPDEAIIAYLASDEVSPGEAFVRSGGLEATISHLNTELLGDVALPRSKRVDVESFDGAHLDAWVLKPPGFDPTQTYPAILEIHGGPYYVLFGHTFFHELQLLAARGYVVLYGNPRGSQGYGQEFASANRGDWGGIDFKDLMAMADWLVQQEYVDSDRIGVAGGSFGGFMTNWIVTQTDRFKAAVAQRSISNHQSAYGTSDVAYGPMDWIFLGPPWEQPELYRERSPITHVTNVRTPLLLIHSEQDLRCSIEQAEQLFTALKRLGREVELVRIPDGDHNLWRSGRPTHREERLRCIVRWFDDHLGAASPHKMGAPVAALRS